MDKLRKYIQECWGDIVYSDYDKVATLEDLEYNYRYIRFLLSTEAMFIKWLVDNDKIDLSNEEYFYQDTIYELEQAQLIKDLSDYLIMKLSISDNPIDFLISVLKKDE